MTRQSKLITNFAGAFAPAIWVVVSLVAAGVAVAAPCAGPGAPTNTQTRCLTAIPLPFALTSFDISFVNPDRAEYYLGDRSSKGLDVIDTNLLQYKRTVGLDKPFTGLVFNSAGTAVNNAASGPAGVAGHGRWLYGGDGNSTLHVIDLDEPTASVTKQVIATGGKFRLDEMALTNDGTLMLAANNADDPPFATLFATNGDNATSNVSILKTILVDPGLLPSGFGLGIEQPAWDAQTQRFYTAIPIIANNPPGCNYGQLSGPTTCMGGLLVTDPLNPTATQGAFDPVKNVGVIALNGCGPNGASVGPNDNILLGCTPGNFPAGTTTLVINARNQNYAQVSGIWGSDEVWYNKGDNRYYTGSSGQPKSATGTTSRGSVFGVIDGSSVLIESIPVSSGTHSIAADSKRNLIFVPNIYASPPTALPLGDQNFTGAVNASATVSQLVCGTSNGCIAVYKSGQGTANPDGSTPTTPTVQIVDNNSGSNSTLFVGDSFTLQITGAQPFSIVSVTSTGSVAGVSVSSTASYGYTDGTGFFRLIGIVPNSILGSWQQTWSVGGAAAQPSPLQFAIVPHP